MTNAIAHRRSTPRFFFALLASALPLLAGCASESGGVADEADGTETAAALTAGVNGSACLHSPFNCKLRESGGNRVTDVAGGEQWAVGPGVVRDGDANVMISDTNGGHIQINYGQIRHFAGATYVLAMSTVNASAGWYPIDAVVDQDSLRARIGNVDAKDPHQGTMACYEIANDADASLIEKKVVRDAKGAHERAGDYMSLPRANGRRYANLAFNAPGDALGAPAVDIFPAGTKFQRVDVPTESGKPHLSVQLYVQAADGHFTQPSGTMTFIYGYVTSVGGVRRFGWMALDALHPSQGC